MTGNLPSCRSDRAQSRPECSSLVAFFCYSGFCDFCGNSLFPPQFTKGSTTRLPRLCRVLGSHGAWWVAVLQVLMNRAIVWWGHPSAHKGRIACSFRVVGTEITVKWLPVDLKGRGEVASPACLSLASLRAHPVWCHPWVFQSLSPKGQLDRICVRTFAWTWLVT